MSDLLGRWEISCAQFSRDVHKVGERVSRNGAVYEIVAVESSTPDKDAMVLVVRPVLANAG